MAGLTIWALMVPQAMAYAGIAGVPVPNGLYVMPLAVVGYALFGSSRHLFVGPARPWRRCPPLQWRLSRRRAPARARMLL
jgi:MFS superfamily sulfate permease-like transporter